VVRRAKIQPLPSFRAIATMSTNEHPAKKPKHNNDSDHPTPSLPSTTYLHASTNRTGPTAFLPSSSSSTTTTTSLDHTTWTGDFSFVQLADTQFGLGESIVSAVLEGALKNQMALDPKLQEYCDAVAAARPTEGEHDHPYEFLYQRELEFSRKAVAAINTLVPRPAFTCVCGDLINAYPTEQKGRLGQQRQVNDFKQIFADIHADIPLVCVCGNHDVGDRPNSISIDVYNNRFGDDYYSFVCRGVKFIVLNTQLYKDGRDVPAHVARQNVWLKEQLEQHHRAFNTDASAAATSATTSSTTTTSSTSTTGAPPRIIVFSHISPFINDPYESSEYFNLAKETRLPLLQELSDAGCTHWFCGHYHRNAGGIYRNTRDGTKTLECVTSAAVGTTLTTKQRKVATNDDGSAQGKGTVVLAFENQLVVVEWWWWYREAMAYLILFFF